MSFTNSRKISGDKYLLWNGEYPKGWDKITGSQIKDYTITEIKLAQDLDLSNKNITLPENISFNELDNVERINFTDNSYIGVEGVEGERELRMYYDENKIKIGAETGETNQGINTIAIGDKAGKNNQHNNTIILNGTGQELNTTQENSIYIKPMREITDLTNNKKVYYNETTGEISYTSLTQAETEISFNEYYSEKQETSLPSILSQPIILQRKTLFYNSTYETTLPGGIGQSINMTFNTPIINQLNLIIDPLDNTNISPSEDIQNQYVEIYVNLEIQGSNNTGFSLRIIGTGFDETIDSRLINKSGIYYLTYGPHIFVPEQWEGTTSFNFALVNNTNASVLIKKYKILFKSNYL